MTHRYRLRRGRLAIRRKKDASPPHYPRCRGLRRGFGICNCPRPCRSAPATKRPWQSGLAGRKGRLLRVPPLRLLPASPLLLASPVLPALLRIWLLPALSLWLLEPALLSALVVGPLPKDQDRSASRRS